MTSDQGELDFAGSRRIRVAQALLAGGERVRCAVPLSETDRLMLLCMRELAQGIADEMRNLSEAVSQARISARVMEIVCALDGVSEPFALETARYLTETVYRLARRSAGDGALNR